MIDERAGDLLARIAGVPDAARRRAIGTAALDELYREVIRAAAPPNPQFERERIIVQLAVPRELAFVLGFLSEGENEAGLLLELMTAASTAEPGVNVDHLLDEAWYYVRTSIDPNWQLDDGPPSEIATLLYLVSILDRRLNGVAERRPCQPPPEEPAPQRAARLRALRDATVRPTDE